MIFLNLLLVILFFHPSFSLSDAKANKLEKLLSLPYAQWSRAKADPKKRGVTLYNRSQASEGYNMYSDDKKTVLLTNMNGETLHRWEIEWATRCEWARLMDDGSILAVLLNQSLVKLDWNSNKIWEYKKPSTHHEVEVLDDGTIAVPTRDLHPFQGRKVLFDVIDFLDPDGKLIDRWSTYDHLAEIQDHHPLSELDSENHKIETKTYDYYHMNSIQSLPDTRLGRYDNRFKKGNLLVCLRNKNLVLILEKKSKKIVWSWGTEDLDYPHMPRMVENGNILIFDNGAARDYSRIVEINPLRKKIVWEYQDDPPESFYTQHRGSIQRLPNGNTLICESLKGRVFEVNKKGQKVWEFFNPVINKYKKRQRIYRFLRFPKEKFKDLSFLKRSQ